MNLEMLNTLETLANKLSSGQQNNKGILVDNNGNKLNGLTAVISRSEKTQHQHHYQKESIYHRSSPNSNNNINSKYTDKWVTWTSPKIYFSLPNPRHRHLERIPDMMLLVIFRSTPTDMIRTLFSDEISLCSRFYCLPASARRWRCRNLSSRSSRKEFGKCFWGNYFDSH